MTLLVTLTGPSCLNYGNSLIDWSLRRDLPMPFDEIDVWSLPSYRKTIGRVIIYGCCLYEPSLVAFLKALPSSVDIWAIGVSTWDGVIPEEYKRLRIRSMGARDPHTYDFFKDLCPTKLVGCPTMFVPNSPMVSKTGILVSAVHGPNRYLTDEFMKGVPRFTLAMHEDRDLCYAYPNRKDNIINLRKLPVADVFSLYRSAKVVVTSRLHGLLPAIGRPVFYFNDPSNPRQGLVTRLGIPIRSVRDLPHYGSMATSYFDIEAFIEMKRNYKSLLAELLGSISKDDPERVLRSSEPRPASSDRKTVS